MRYIAIATACFLLIVILVGCTSGDERSGGDMQMPESEKQQATPKEVQPLTAEDMDDKDAVSKEGWDVADKEQWTKDKEESFSQTEGGVVERTVEVVGESGGEIQYVDHPSRGDRTVLITPLEFVHGETPLVVSLHGFGGDSAGHAAYVPLHERVNSSRFALILPNGEIDSQGNPFWNPTDECCDGNKSGEDDVAYLTELVAEANKVKDFGPVYFFGYSNGGFMSYHIACKGLPELRAVASLAGTSYGEDSSCDGALPFPCCTSTALRTA